MWLSVAAGNAAFNLDQSSKLFVEETGAGAALKADIGGKTVLVSYFSDKADARTALESLLEKLEAGAKVVRL